MAAEAPTPEAANDAEPPKRRRSRAAPKPVPAESAEDEEDEGENEDGSPRRGWWQRTFGA